MEKEISLLDILKIIKNRIVAIMLIVLLFIVSSAGISIFLNEKLYESTSTLTFGVESTRDTDEINKITGEPIQEKYIKFGTHSVNNESFQFYKELLRSTELLEEVIDTLNLDMTNKELEESISLENPEGSGTLLLVVQSKQHENTDEIADEVVSVFENINLEITELDNIKIINSATIPKVINTQNVKLNVLIATIIGLTIGVIVVIVTELIKKNID